MESADTVTAIDKPKKLIEVFIPLVELGIAGAREKSIGIGHPAAIHMWWSRKPVGVTRALLFAQLVNDPESEITDADPQQRAAKIKAERTRLNALMIRLALFKDPSHMATVPAEITELLVDNVFAERSNDEVLQLARAEIVRCYPDGAPLCYDPFSGGGTTVLAAQQLGLPAFGNDLNPVAVMVGKITTELPQRFADCPAVNPDMNPLQHAGHGVHGLAADIDYYAQRLRVRALDRLQESYPMAVPAAENGTEQDLPIVAWLWVRTVATTDAYYRGKHTPLLTSFALRDHRSSSTPEKTNPVWLEPRVDSAHGTLHFDIIEWARLPAETPEQIAERDERLKTARKGAKVDQATFRCLYSGATINPEYIRQEGKAGRIGYLLYAVVTLKPTYKTNAGKLKRYPGKLFFAPSAPQLAAAQVTRPDMPTAIAMPRHALGHRVYEYGISGYDRVFSDRQMGMLDVLCDEVAAIEQEVVVDAGGRGWDGDATPLADGGRGATAYGQAIAIYLGAVICKMTDRHNTMSRWLASDASSVGMFDGHSIGMKWDFAEAHPFSATVGSMLSQIRGLVDSVRSLDHSFAGQPVAVTHGDAITYTPAMAHPPGRMISTDPPYYDNIGYANISDFFYMWHRRLFKNYYPALYTTIATPKDEELIVEPARHASRVDADEFFRTGMQQAIARMAENNNDVAPAVIYYAFKQKELEKEGVIARGWASFLRGVIESGYAVIATWPVRTETAGRTRARGSNALASSIVLVCRPRPGDAEPIDRQTFDRRLTSELRNALKLYIAQGLPPADIPQSMVGIGIGIFSEHAGIIEASDELIGHDKIDQILMQINEVYNELRHELIGLNPVISVIRDFFTSYGFKRVAFDDINRIATPSGIPVEELGKTGVAYAAKGVFCLFPPEAFSIEADLPSGEEQHPEVLHRLLTKGFAGGFGGSGKDSEPRPDLPAAKRTIWGVCMLLAQRLTDGGIPPTAELYRAIDADRGELDEDLIPGVPILARLLHSIAEDDLHDARLAHLFTDLLGKWELIRDFAKNLTAKEQHAKEQKGSQLL